MVCERGEASACLIMLSAKQGSHWYHFYNVFGMTRPGIDPTPILTYRTRSGRSTTWAIAAVNNINSLQRGTTSYWLNSVQKCSNWRWLSAIFGNLIEAHNRVWYSILKTMNPNRFINSAVQNLKKEKKKYLNNSYTFCSAYRYNNSVFIYIKYLSMWKP